MSPKHFSLINYSLTLFSFALGSVFNFILFTFFFFLQKSKHKICSRISDIVSNHGIKVAQGDKTLPILEAYCSAYQVVVHFFFFF